MFQDEIHYAADRYKGAERRIEYMTVAIGAVAAIAALGLWGWRSGAGVGCGAVLSWINYRWMKQGVNALAEIARPQQGAEKVHVPRGVYLKFIGRFALLIVGAYVILTHFRLPVASVMAGFFAVVAAVLVEMAGLLFRNNQLPHADS